MTDTGDSDEIDAEVLQSELSQIKRAVGLQDEYPYWWRWWLVEGVTVALLFPLMNAGMAWGFSYPLIALIIGLFGAHQIILWRIQQRYEEPMTDVPSWGRWHLIFFAGIGAAILGFMPIIDQVDGLGETPAVLVTVGIILGIAYAYMGQLLEAYDIRNADCYAFYLGGIVIMAVSAALPWVSAIEGWEFATLGVTYGLYGVLAYAVLSRY